MDPRIPAKDEKKRLEEIYRFHKSSELYMLFMLYPALFLIVLTFFFDTHPLFVFAVIMFTIFMLAGIVVLIIKRHLIRKCPGCATRGVPLLPMPKSPGYCTKCGLILDPNYKDPNDTLSKKAPWKN
ncbi:MAG: hypothetical protein GX846_01570 [Deltaproteobacteria bacterium]|nr:hypothetical protein [Deltaproteobacteria bacterium]